MKDDGIEESGTPGKGGQVGRRGFLKIALGAGLAVAVEACAPAPPPAAQPTSAPAATAVPAAPAAKPTAAPAAAPKPTAAPAVAKPTGTLTVAIPGIGNPAYIPTRIQSDAMQVSIASWGETLLGHNSDSSLAPLLAESWSVSPDGKAITFDLRRGIKFHDGTDFTSADVKHTLEMIVRQDSTNMDVTMWKSALDRVEAPTPQRAVVYLKERNIQIPLRLAGPSGSVGQVIVSKSYIEKVGENEAAQKPVGTGPWKFVEYRAGELVRFEAVENHWRQTPAFKELVLRQVPEETTRVAMLLRGEADLVMVTAASTKRLQDAGVNLFVDRTAYSLFVSLQGQFLPSKPQFDPKVPWAADPADKAAWDRAKKVREAMSLAIDRKTIIDTILAGQGVPAIYLHALPGSVFEDKSWRPDPYDPARAKQLLAEAGYPSGFEFPMILAEMPVRPGSIPMGEAVAQYWQAVGLRPKLSRAEYVATLRPGLVNRALAGTAFAFSRGTYDDPAVGEAGGFTSTIDTLFGAEYPPLDALVDKALATANFEERKAINLQIAQMTIDNRFYLPVAWVNGLWGGSKRVKAYPRVPGITGAYNFEYVVPSS